MPNDDHIAQLVKGSVGWNAWRDENVNIRSDLRGETRQSEPQRGGPQRGGPHCGEPQQREPQRGTLTKFAAMRSAR
jgi:hypothetical protein